LNKSGHSFFIHKIIIVNFGFSIFEIHQRRYRCDRNILKNCKQTAVLGPQFGKSSNLLAEWKFHDFTVTQLLREINFWDSRSAKFGISTHFEALNLDFYEFLNLLKAEITQINKFRAPKMAKLADLQLLDPSKILTEKS